MLKTSRGAIRSLLTLVLLAGGLTEAAFSDPEDGADSSPPMLPTCPARSLNYITESLPQQCFKTPWPSSAGGSKPSTGVNTEGAETISTTAGQTTVTGNLVPQNATKPTTLASTAPLEGPTYLPITPSTDTQASPTAERFHQPNTPQVTEPDSEGESPLDNANFLSFEEWKKQNLARAGQSADHVGNGRAVIGEGETRRRPASVNNALDSIGEDAEIEIDFGGFVNQATHTRAEPTQQAGERDEGSKEGDSTDDGARLADLSRPHGRGKDAGKTCKERSNYASFDCAATVLKTNPECKGSTSVLVENKDSYLLNECSAKNKFLIVELCNDILVDTVVLANFEFFSSMFRTFKVSVSDRYPVKLDKWRELGTFEARNSRQVQAFLVENPLIWARYLRIEFLTHFGNEYYCPVSLLRVHGTTMMEEFNYDVKGSRVEDDPEGEIEGAEKDNGKAADVVTAENMKSKWPSSSGKTFDVARPTLTQFDVPSPMPDPPSQEVPASPSVKPTASRSTSINSLLRKQMEMIFSSKSSCNPVCKAGDSPGSRTSALSPSVTTTQPTIGGQRSQHTTAAPGPAEDKSITQTALQNTTLPPSSSASPDSTISDPSSSTKVRSEQKSSVESSQFTPRSPSPSTRASSSPTQPPPSNPTMQESFFKSVHKRLQLLESNSTLSLQYIEEQSRILRDAFAKVEKRQLAKTSAFLDTLNTTVLTEMRDFRNQYDQLWQSIVLELSSQRAQSQQEILALSSRLTLLADEVVFHKRIAILQFLLILVCLGLVLFSRSSSSVATYLELPPVVQHAFNKSSSSLSRYTAHFDTPPASPSSTRPPSRYGFLSRSNPSHGRGPSDGSGISDNEGRKSPNIEYSPPTPTSQHSNDMAHPNDVNGEFDEEPPDEILGDRQIKNSPAAPQGTGDEQRKELVEGDHLRPG